MIIVTTGTLVIESLRYRKGFGWMNDVMCFILGGTLRKHEMEGKFTGSFYYFLGVTITAACFPKSCASLGICQLALADPSASYFGRQTRHVYWSRIENGFFGIGRNKGILGFLGGALTCLPFNYYVLSIAKIPAGGVGGVGSGAVAVTRASIAAASFALGLAGSFADLCVPTPALTMPKKILGVPMLPFHVDDNVVVPIFSGFACQKIFEMLGWSGGVDLAKFLIV
jgi:dolichol kinase